MMQAVFNMMVRVIRRMMETGIDVDTALNQYPKLTVEERTAIKAAVTGQ